MKRIHYIRLALFALLLQYVNPTTATELSDSIDTYQNQIVSMNAFVQGRGVLTSNNVTVTPTGNLVMTAPERIDITGPFEVQLGGWLTINGGQQWPIVYDYDSSGNIIARQKD